MGKKGRKTRWRKLPISIGNGRTTCGGVNEEVVERDDIKTLPPTNNVAKTTFNEEEYTKITTPRQDMLFKKGYLGKKKSVAVTPPQDSVETQSADSVESDQYICEEQVQPQYMYPGTGYMDHSGLYYINNSYEVYDPYTGNVTVIVGPGYPTGPHTSVLTAVPCQPVPLQPVEWFNPSIPQPHPAYSVPMYSTKKKRNSIDSQNCSGQSSETTGPPGSPQEPIESTEHPLYPPQYVYPGYMFGAPLYNMNGVTVQGVVPQSAPLPPPADQAKRRKKRRRRRRGGVTDEGSESSCEDMLSCDASGVAESHSGASSDTAPGSSSSKTNSDSGIHTDPTALTSGANSPRLPIDEPYFHTETNGNEEVITSYQDQEEVKETQEEPQRLTLEIEQESVISTESLPITEEESGSVEPVTEDNKCEPSIETDPTVTNIPNNESVITDLENNDINTEEVVEESSEITPNIAEEEVMVNDEKNMMVEQTENETRVEQETEKMDENNVDVITSRLAEQTLQEGTCERPITEAVTKWLRSQGSTAVKLSNSSSPSESEDEGIEEGEDALVPTLTSTGQKNGQGNPFPASSPSSDNRKRVAINDHHRVEEEDWALSVGQMCDAKRSVHKYYSLGAAINGESPTPPAVVLKTAMHLGQAGPFPCGICCILQ